MANSVESPRRPRLGLAAGPISPFDGEIDPLRPAAGRHGQPAKAKLAAAGGLWVTGARLVQIAAVVLTNVVLARKLSRDTFAGLLLFRSVASFGAVCAMFGLESVVVRLVGESVGAGRSARARQVLALCAKVAMVSSVVAALTAFAVIWGWGAKIGLPSSALLAGLLAIAVLLLAANQLVGEGLRGIGDLRGASLFGGASGGVIANVLFLGAFFALALGMNVSLTLTVAVSVGTLFVSLVVAAWTARRTVPRTLAQIKPVEHVVLPELQLKAMLWLCLPVFLNQAVWFIALQGDLWIAGANLSLGAVALYGAARRLIFLVGLPLELLNATIVASIPRMHAGRDFDGLQRLIRRSTTLAVAPAFIALLALWIAPAGILHLFFGAAYRGAAGALMILAVGQLVASWVGPAGVTLMMTGRHVAALGVNAVGAVALFVAAPIAARAFGLTGLAAAAAGIFSAQRLAEWFLARRMVGVSTHFSWVQLGAEVVHFSRRIRS